MFVRSLATLAGLVAAVSAQFVPAPTDFNHTVGYAGIPVRSKLVPDGICETQDGVKSFSGYADISEKEHIFFWFFETRNGDPKDAPLTIWINGGPGSSSMIGLFQEHGPCQLYNNGTLFNNPYSWNNVSNVIYIDNPVGTGLSYSEAVPAYTNPNYGSNTVVLPSDECPDYASPWGTCGTYSLPDITTTANSTLGAADNLWKTLQGFMGAFPDYARNGVHFATESYGGHYGPVVSEYFLEQNAKNIEGAHPIQLQSVTINNGWYDPLIQYQAYYNFTVHPGNTYDIKLYNKTIQDELYNNLYGRGNCVDQIRQCYDLGRDDVCSTADSFCAAYVESLFDIIGSRDEYDAREMSTEDQPDPFPYNAYVAYLNTPKVQKSIGAMTNYSDSTQYVGSAFAATGDDARESLTIENIRKLLESNVTVTLWAGDADYNCNWLGGQVVAEEINHPGYATAGYAALKTPDHAKHGEVRQSGLFSFTRIYEAGHEVPFYQPSASLALIERSINGLDIATGTVRVEPGYATEGPLESTFREGNRTVQNDFLPINSTYNQTTDAPNPAPAKSKAGKKGDGPSERHSNSRLFLAQRANARAAAQKQKQKRSRLLFSRS